MRSFAMMELTTCAFIVTLVSLVSATPYGYGVKGGAGALAAAESSGVAGAYGSRGDIPAGTPPFGSGFSGSFTKSASSSSSSSSASSSSSSSSFSYTGTVPAGFPNQGTNGNTGCSYGNCQNSGSNEIPGNQGANSGVQRYNAANSAAIAGYGAAPGANCQGSLCNGNSGKCSSGQCQPKPHTEVLPIGHDSNEKCITGKCELNTQSGPSASEYDNADDIHFVAHSKDQSFNDKTKGYSAGSNCRNGDCGPSASDAQPSFAPRPTNSYYSTNPSNNPSPANANSGMTPGYSIPATHLETPNINSNCNSGTCKTDHSKPIHESLPASYNVPSYYDYKQNPSCTNGKCNNQPKGSYSSTPSNPISTNYLGPQDVHSSKGPSYATPSSSCNGPSCYPQFGSGTPTSPTGPTPQNGPHSYSEPNDKLKPSSENIPVYTGGFGGPPGLLKPNEYSLPSTGPNYHTHPSTTLNNQPTSANTPTGCNTPSCSSPGSSYGVNPQPNYGNNKPSTPGEKQPSYTGGFGGPTGILKPNEFNMPTSVTSKPIYPSNPTYNTPSTSVTGCKTSNCYESSSVVGATSTNTQSGSYGLHQESVNVNVPDNKTPVYTGGFGGPAGMLKPDEFDIQVPIHSGGELDIKVPVHSTNPSYTSHTPISSSTGCKTPNCNGYPSNTPVGSYGSPSVLPPYTGGYGGPPGVLKPNEYQVPHTTPNGYKPAYTGAFPNSTPTSNSVAGCKTPNCVPVSDNDSTPQSSYGIPKPIAANPSSIPFPGYTTNYRPVGVTNPTPSAVAPISPNYANAHPLHPHGIYFDKCKTGNCGAHPPSGVDGSAPSGFHDNSAGCKTGNCGSYPTSGSGVSGQPGSYDVNNPNTVGKPASTQYPGGYGNPSSAVTPSDYISGSSSLSNTGVNTQSGSDTGSKQELPTYTGGFGAPPGLLKPNDYSKPDVTSLPNKPLTGLSTPATCTSDKCNPKESSPSLTGYNVGLNGAHATASSSASADAIAYSGGFGGPPGLLTPYDDGKVDLKKILGQNQGLHYGGANTPSTDVTGPSGTQSNIGLLGGSVVGATAGSASIASANSGSYGANNYGIHQAGNGVKGASPCGGGCGSGYQGGLQATGNYAAAGAKSLSSAGSYSAGGSYASSSASAHSSAGAYTKGGYGKR